MKRKNVVFLLPTFMIVIFLVSLIPPTVANTTSTEEEPRATNIGVGITDGKFTKTDLAKSYVIDVTPGMWNITLETFSVRLHSIPLFSVQVFSRYLDEYSDTWEYFPDRYLDYNDVFMLEEGLMPVISNGTIMLFLSFVEIKTEANWTDAYHYKIHVSKADLAAETNGNVNIYLEEDSAKIYPFTVATTGWYNLTYSANDTSWQSECFIFNENSDLYDVFDLRDYISEFRGVYYFSNDITYHYIIFGSGIQGINANFSLVPMTLAATISETGSVSLDFAADEDYKFIAWTGSLEGLFSIKLTLPGGFSIGDVAFGIQSYSPLWDWIWANNNVTLFIAPQILNDWSVPIIIDDIHWRTYVAYSKDNIDEDRGTLYWSNEPLGILLDKTIIGAISGVDLTIEEHAMETLTPGGPSVSVTVNDSRSDTAFKVLNFTSKFGYEYKITAEPDPESHVGGVMVDSTLVTAEHVPGPEDLFFGLYNVTVVHSVIGGAIGSGDDQTFYIIADVVTSGTYWGTVTFNLTETAPTSIDVGDEVTEVLILGDSLQVYQVELKKDKAYTIDVSADMDSGAEMFMVAVVGTDGKIPDIKATKSALAFQYTGELLVATLLDLSIGLSNNQLSIESLEDQTIYIAVITETYAPSTVHLKVSEMEEPFGFEGVLAYIMIGLIPAALIIGLLIGKKTG